VVTFIVSKITGDTMVFFPLDEQTGEIMDDLYHLRRLRDQHRAAWGGVCASCQRTFPCSERKTLTDAVNAEQSRRRERVWGERVRRPYKRADIPTSVVLAAVSVYRFRAFETLSATYPEKVVHAAYLRDARRGLLEFGTSERRPWITPEGREWIEHERLKVYGGE
jgi:hypothetical protein